MANTISKINIDGVEYNLVDKTSNYLTKNNIWVGTQTEYDALTNKSDDVLYIVTSSGSETSSTAKVYTQAEWDALETKPQWAFISQSADDTTTTES